MRRLAAVACLVLLATSVFAQDDLPPFIYYPTDGGYVIERTDGTDSRILSVGILSDRQASNPVWSPSGTWLASQFDDYGMCGAPAGHSGVFAAASDASTVSGYIKVIFAWSPVVDRLFMLGTEISTEDQTWLIVDLTKDRQWTGRFEGEIDQVWVQWIGETALIVSTAGRQTRLTIIEEPDQRITEQLVDSQVVALLPAGRALIADSDRGGIVVEQLDLPDGHLGEPSGPRSLPFTWEHGDERQLYADAQYSYPLDWDFLQVLGDGRFLFRTPDGLVIHDYSTGTDDPITWDFEAYSMPQISPDERFLAYVDDGPVIVDRTTGEAAFIPPTTLSFMGNLGGRVEWHPTQNWLISVEDGPAYCASTSFTQVTDGTYRREIDACGSRAGCVQWLPEHVDPSQFPPYERPSEPRPHTVLNAGDWVTVMAWSDDSRTLFAWGDRGALAAVPATAHETIAPTDIPPVPPRSTGLYENVALLAESAHYAATLEGVFDKHSGEVVLTYDDAIWRGGARFEISADERFMISAGMTQPLRVWSLEDMRLVYEGLTTTAAAISPDSRSVAVAGGWEVRLYDLTALVDRR